MAWYNASWQYRVKITVQSSQVSANLTDFPVYVDLSDLPAGFHTNVNQTDARDIRVTTSDEVTEVPREVVFYDAGNDEGELHFKAPSLSSTVDTDFYIYYGNSGATEPLSTATYGSYAVWNNYNVVYHLNESGNGTTGEFKDSTSNNNHLSSPGSSNTPDRVVGAMGYGQDFVKANGDKLTSGSSISAPNDAEFTMSAWGYMSEWPNYTPLISQGSGWGNHNNPYVAIITRAQNEAFISVNQVAGGSRITHRAVFGTVSTELLGTLHHYVGVREGDTLKAYLNGVLVDSYNLAANYDVDGGGAILINAGGIFDGMIDEARYAIGSAKSASWISTEYNNQSSPSTFYSVGTQEVGVNTETKTVQVKARIKKNSNTKTIQVKSRIQDTGITKSVSAKAKIVKQSNVTVSAKSKVVFYGEWSDVWGFTVQNVTEQEKTVSAKAKILLRESKDISAKSRILNTYDSTVQSKARIKASQEQEVSAKARIKSTGETVSVGSKGRIKQWATTSVSSQARLLFAQTTTVSALGKIKQIIEKSLTGLARLKITSQSQLSSQTRLVKTEIHASQAQARIKTTPFAQATARSRLKQTLDKSADVKARVKGTGLTVSVSTLARVVNYSSLTIEAKARVKTSQTANITARARVKILDQNQAVSGLARIVQSQIAVITSQAMIKQGESVSVQALARIVNTVFLTLQALARVVETQTKTLQAKANILHSTQSRLSAQALISPLGRGVMLSQLKAEIKTTQLGAVISNSRLHAQLSLSRYQATVIVSKLKAAISQKEIN